MKRLSLCAFTATAQNRFGQKDPIGIDSSDLGEGHTLPFVN